MSGLGCVALAPMWPAVDLLLRRTLAIAYAAAAAAAAATGFYELRTTVAGVASQGAGSEAPAARLTGALVGLWACLATNAFATALVLPHR